MRRARPKQTFRACRICKGELAPMKRIPFRICSTCWLAGGYGAALTGALAFVFEAVRWWLSR